MKNTSIRLGVKAAAPGADAEILLYGEICPDGWKWSDEDASALDLDKAVKAAKKGGAEKLVLRINSPGGDVFQALAMRAILLGCGLDIDISIEGLCASAATILSCLPGARVRACAGSMLMIHNPRTYSGGDAAEHIKTAERLAKLEADFRAIYSAKCGRDENEIKNWMDAETWFSAREALDNGLIDEIEETQRAAAVVAPEVLGAMLAMYARVPVDALCVRGAESARTPAMYARVPVDALAATPPTAGGYGSRGDDDTASHTGGGREGENAESGNTRPEGGDAGNCTGGGHEGGSAGNGEDDRRVGADAADPGDGGNGSGSAERSAPGAGRGGTTTREGEGTNDTHEGETRMDITLEQLRSENPELLAQIVASGETAERQRMTEIDELTPAGFEAEAASAKASGESAIDFHKRVIALQRARAQAHLTARREETAPAAGVTAGAAEDDGGEDEVDACAKEIALYAKTYSSQSGSMY